jgi:CHAD domain-containing protein
VAPLAATIAAGVAVRVGFAIGRAARERRSGPPEVVAVKPRLGMLAGERPVDGLRRMILAQADFAVQALEGARSGDESERAVHETRKAIKRLRTLLRLLKGELGKRRYEREDAALRRIAHDLAPARDTEVALETFERLIADGSKHLRGRDGTRRLRGALRVERDRARRHLTEGAVTRRRAISELTAFQARVSAWELPPADRAVERDARRLYEQGHRGLERARRGKRPHTKRMHEWRKRVKDLRYAAEALGPAQQTPAAGSTRKDKDARWLKRTAERADELSELLGEEHDLAVLTRWIEKPRATDGPSPVRVGQRTRKELLRLIDKRRGKLRARTLRKGTRLYRRRRGKRFARRVRAARRAFS